MSVLKRLWTQSMRFIKALEGVDDPAGDYMFALERRVEKLERAVEHLEKELHSCARNGGIQQ